MSASNFGARLVLLCLIIGAMPFAAVWAQSPADEPQPASDAAESVPTADSDGDLFGRTSPRGTFIGYIEAISVQDYRLAAEYLDLSHLPAQQRDLLGPGQARLLQRALDRGGMMPPAVMLSDDPDGRLDDNLNPHLDRLGTIRIGDREVPFLAERHERDGAVIWLISSSTLEGLPDLVREAQPFNIDVLLPPVLLSTTWQGVSIGHWVAILVLGALSYLLSYVLVFVGVQIFRLALRQRLTGFSEGVLNAFVLPARIYLAVWLLVLAVRYLGIAIVARQYFGAVLIVVTWAASLLLVWRLISLLSDLAHRQLLKHHNLGAMSALQFFRRAAKIVVLVVGVVIVLDTLGYNVTTGLAALGIGGLAVALGAQKTIENLVGSLTLIFDQPIRVGDYCSVGETSGVVEQIGMRSSRLRTVDRTLVVIPNSEFASHRIENFALRDQFRFSPTLSLRADTTPNQVRWILVKLRELLYAHPKVDPDPARVRFVGLADGALQLEVFAYIRGKSFDDFLEVQEDLYLRIMDVIANSGSGLAFQSHTLYHAADSGVSPEKRDKVEAQVQEWRAKGELDIPSFDPRRITELRNRIVYPPEDSSAGRKRR